MIQNVQKTNVALNCFTQSFHSLSHSLAQLVYLFSFKHFCLLWFAAIVASFAANVFYSFSQHTIQVARQGWEREEKRKQEIKLPLNSLTESRFAKSRCFGDDKKRNGDEKSECVSKKRKKNKRQSNWIKSNQAVAKQASTNTEASMKKSKARRQE